MTFTTIKNFHPRDPFHNYFFKKSGEMIKQKKGHTVKGKQYKKVKTGKKIPGGYKDRHFYTLKGNGSLIISKNYPLFTKK
jgi:hypothetical protein